MATGRNIFTSLFVLAVAPLLLLLVLQPQLETFAPTWLSAIFSTASSMLSSSETRSKIPIVMAGISFGSHLEKITPIAAGLVKLGYPVTFVTGEDFRDVVVATGASFEPMDGPPGLMSAEQLKAMLAITDGLTRHNWAMANLFAGGIPNQFSSIQRAFRESQAKYGVDAPLIYLHDCSYFGNMPALLGGEGIRPTSDMAIGIGPITLGSKDTFPFPSLKPPATGANATAVHLEAYKKSKSAPPELAFNSAVTDILKAHGATTEPPLFADSMGGLSDYLLQLGIPEYEYPRSDIAPKLRYLGAPKTVGIRADLPSWWDDVLVAKKAGKKIVAVTQGSAYPDLTNLLYPTLEALEGREDVLVVATLVLHEPKDIDIKIPANVRVAKFVPFDILMPIADLLIASGGYGTVLQAVAHGVPLVLAGTSEDKGHNGVLAAWAGIAVNLATARPGVEKIRDAVVQIFGEDSSSSAIGSEKIGGDPTYKAKAVKLMRANSGYDPISIVDATILEVVREAKKGARA